MGRLAFCRVGIAAYFQQREHPLGVCFLLPMSSVQAGAGGPRCGLQTPRALTSATCPWGAPPARRAALHPAQPRVSESAPRAGGCSARRGFTKAGAQVVPFCLVVHDPPPLHTCPSPLLCGGRRPPPPTPPDMVEPRAGPPGTPALQLGPSWKTPLQGALGHEPGPCWGCPGPQCSGTERPPALPPLRAPPSTTSRHHGRRPGRSPGHSACLGLRPAG